MRATAEPADAVGERGRRHSGGPHGRFLLWRNRVSAVRPALARGGARNPRGGVPRRRPPRPAPCVDRRADAGTGESDGPGRAAVRRAVQRPAPIERTGFGYSGESAAGILPEALAAP